MSAAAGPGLPGRAEPDSSHHIPAAGSAGRSLEPGPDPSYHSVLSPHTGSLLTASLS